MKSSIIKLIGIPFFSVLLSACGSGDSIIIGHEEISQYDGDWQSTCTYNTLSDSSSLESIHIENSEFTIYIDEYDNATCFGGSSQTTEMEGVLYYGDYKPFTSSYCENTIEVDFVTTAIFEDQVAIPSSEITDHLGHPENITHNITHNIMCSRNNDLFTGDLSFDDGSTEESRPLSINYDNPFHAY